MKKKVLKILVTLGVIVAGIGAMLTARFIIVPQDKSPQSIRPLRAKGNPRAEIQIIEYFDFRCGPCGYGTRWLKEIMDKYPGRIYIEVRYFPLHLSNGALEARFAECALKQGKFWEVHDKLMFDQNSWIRLPDPESFYLEMAKEMGMDQNKLARCWADPDLYDAIIAMKDEGTALGVNATPTYFINGEMVVGSRRLQTAVLNALGISGEDMREKE